MFCYHIQPSYSLPAIKGTFLHAFWKVPVNVQGNVQRHTEPDDCRSFPLEALRARWYHTGAVGRLGSHNQDPLSSNLANRIFHPFLFPSLGLVTALGKHEDFVLRHSAHFQNRWDGFRLVFRGWRWHWLWTQLLEKKIPAIFVLLRLEYWYSIMWGIGFLFELVHL